MSQIKVKNNENTSVVYDGIEYVVVPTVDGGEAVYRKWDGADRYDHQISIPTPLVGKMTSANFTHECVAISSITATVTAGG